ncbi:MAG: vanadium-dependent haloperoxidase [Pedobacter sp.]|jgi:hypothetical protein
MKKILLIFISSFILVSCSNKKDYETVFSNPELYSKTVGLLTDVITYDIFNPPVASRIYAYSNLAAYEVIASKSPKYKSIGIKFKDFKKPDLSHKPVNKEFAALLALMYVGRELTFSKDSTQKIIDGHVQLAKDSGMPQEVIENSQEYAHAFSNAVLDWSKKDNYKQTRSDVKYTVNTGEEGRWVPTPPAYMAAIEPNWMKIRPVMIDSASQFLPKPPTGFNKSKESKFYELADEVYQVGVKLTDEQKAIADFWDCNGFKVNVSGHVMFATKAMTPGGHWMGITGIVCKNQKADFDKTIYSYTGVSIGIMDAFIACWNTKFTYDLLRPETYINQFIDNAWKPYLQTPPFPEYTSGHSIISSSAATILTKIYGESTPFVDSTERRWGWPDRHFKNVKEASHEAALSRLLGGIHYREAMEEGLVEGKKIGELVFNKMN